MRTPEQEGEGAESERDGRGEEMRRGAAALKTKEREVLIERPPL